MKKYFIFTSLLPYNTYGMKKYDTYLFDFDGTLVDSHDSLVDVFDGAYSAVGVKVPVSKVLRLMRIPLFVGYEELNAPNDEKSKKTFGDKIEELLKDDEITKKTKTYEDVKEVLNELKLRGATLGIVTSNAKEHVRDVLRFVGIDEGTFTVIVGHESTEKHKPNPDPIDKAIELLGISKEGVCYVGDALDDRQTGINANVDAILLDRLDEFADESGVVITSLRDLL